MSLCPHIRWATKSVLLRTFGQSITNGILWQQAFPSIAFFSTARQNRLPNGNASDVAAVRPASPDKRIPRKKAKASASQTENQASSAPDKPSARRKSDRLDKEGSKEATRAKSSQDDPAAHASRPKPEPWQVQKAALKRKLGDEGWQPRRRLSPDAVEGIRAMHAQFPDKYTTPMLAKEFKVSPEAIRRILKSKWRPTADEAAARNERWTKRGEKIWTRLVELGMKPPKKWRDMGVGQRAPSKLRREKGAAAASSDGDFWEDQAEEEADASHRTTALADRIF